MSRQIQPEGRGERAAPAPPRPSLWAQARTGGVVAALVGLVLFFAQNLQEVEVHFLWFDWTTRMLWGMLASAAAGALAMFAFMTVRRRERRGE